MTDQDWAYAVGILICAIIWVQIFFDYRKKLVRMMPSMQEAASRKEDFSSRISESEVNAHEILETIEDMRREIASLDDDRIKLQLQVNKKEMVLIPAGRFKMGSSQAGLDEEHPEHTVHLKAYYIDRYEVTNIQYKDFVDGAGHRAPANWRNRTFPEAQKAHHPVVEISWDDVRAYAEWSGKRLPTEAEWERAALGDGRNEYPWGVTCSAEYANYDNVDGGTTPVEHFARGVSPTGIWDMCGNVSEWVNDFYGSKYFHDSPETDPQGPDGGNYKVHRGGAYHENRNGIRGKSRHFSMSNAAQGYIGFRCAMNEQPAEADD